MEFVRRWVEESPYSAFLGVKLDALGDDSARLLLPYNDENSNPGRALHGGCAASLASIGAQAVTRAAMGEESGPWHAAAIQLNYLSAAIGEDVTTEARLLRRGKDICFVEVDIATLEGKSIAHATAMVRARHGTAPAERFDSARDDGAADPGSMGPHVSKTPYMGNRGIHIENMSNGHSRLTMPLDERNADLSEGVHEGAILALLDTTGAMASWAVDALAAGTDPGARSQAGSDRLWARGATGRRDLLVGRRSRRRGRRPRGCTRYGGLPDRHIGHFGRSDAELPTRFRERVEAVGSTGSA
jgi:uncharacterized protein (TIGR00369 family)